MANAKEVKVVGTVPFDCVDRNQEMLWCVAKLNTPLSGLKLSWDGYAPDVRLPNGGILTMINFTISGVDSVGYPFLRRVTKAIRDCGGSIMLAACADVDNAPNHFFPIDSDS